MLTQISIPRSIKTMAMFSRKTVFEVIASILINLTSGWLGVVLISPGIYAVPADQYPSLLTHNLPFATFGFVASLWFVEKNKQL